MSFEWGQCPVCGTVGYRTRHVCPPKWEAREVGEGDGCWYTVYGRDADDAACAYHQLRCEGLYSDVGSMDIEVRPVDDGQQEVAERPITRHRSTMELVPTYSSQRLVLVDGAWS